MNEFTNTEEIGDNVKDSVTETYSFINNFAKSIAFFTNIFIETIFNFMKFFNKEK